MVTGPNGGKIQETWFMQTGRVKYNDPLMKSTWNLEQAIDEDGNQVLKPLGQIIRRENKDGSSFQQDWTDHWFHMFKYPDEFFEIPKHCKHL